MTLYDSELAPITAQPAGCAMFSVVWLTVFPFEVFIWDLRRQILWKEIYQTRDYNFRTRYGKSEIVIFECSCPLILTPPALKVLTDVFFYFVFEPNAHDTSFS